MKKKMMTMMIYKRIMMNGLLSRILCLNLLKVCHCMGHSTVLQIKHQLLFTILL